MMTGGVTLELFDVPPPYLSPKRSYNHAATTGPETISVVEETRHSRIYAES